jgi:hypothetical protein
MGEPVMVFCLAAAHLFLKYSKHFIGLMILFPKPFIRMGFQANVSQCAVFLLPSVQLFDDFIHEINPCCGYVKEP